MRTTLALLVLMALTACSSDPEQATSYAAPQSQDLLDDDLDGVINARDLCMQTPNNAIVDNDGCETLLSQNLENELLIFFGHDQSTLQARFQTELEVYAQFLKQEPELQVLIQAYASEPGTQDYNQQLSQRRAEQVEAALRSYGISSNRIVVQAVGEANAEMGSSSQQQTLTRYARVATKVSEQSAKLKWSVFREQRGALL